MEDTTPLLVGNRESVLVVEQRVGATENPYRFVQQRVLIGWDKRPVIAWETMHLRWLGQQRVLLVEATESSYLLDCPGSSKQKPFGAKLSKLDLKDDVTAPSADMSVGDGQRRGP